MEDEDDDFLKGEVPQNDTVIGITPSSLDPHFRSPSSSVGSPPVLYLPDQSPVSVRICDWDGLLRIAAIRSQVHSVGRGIEPQWVEVSS